jgi:hypothetical protein
MEAETVSETFDYNTILTRLIGREDFIAYLTLFRPMVTIYPKCFNNQQLFILYLWVSYDSHYKQGLFPQTTLTS